MSHLKQTRHKIFLIHINNKLASRYLHHMMFLLFAKLSFIPLLNNILSVRSPCWKGRGRCAEAAVTERDKVSDEGKSCDSRRPRGRWELSMEGRRGKSLPEGDTGAALRRGSCRCQGSCICQHREVMPQGQASPTPQDFANKGELLSQAN